MKNKKNMMIVWVLLVVAFIGFLVYFSINNKKEDSNVTEQKVAEEQNVNMENIQDVNGVKITTLKEGEGDVAKSGDTVAMAYVGLLVDGKVFDSNIDPKTGEVRPFEFTIDSGQVIKGWDIGVAGMKIGEQRKLEIPANLAYGATGAGGVIPPNADLTFIVQLISIK